MTLVCILLYHDMSYWRVASEVRRYLAESYGTDRGEKEITGTTRLPSGLDWEYRAVMLSVPLPQTITPNECADHWQKLLDFVNSHNIRFNLPSLPSAHVYCYPL